MPATKSHQALLSKLRFKNLARINSKSRVGSHHKPTGITTIIFDFGDVLVQDTASRFENKYGWNRLSASAKKSYDRAWHSSETGKTSTAYLLRKIKQIFKLDVPISEINDFMTDTRLIKPIWRLFKQLRKHYQVLILSNNEKLWPRQQAKKAGISLKGITFFNSANIGSQKPHRTPYLFALAKLKLLPAQTVFIDDHLENVKTARKIGMNGIHFTGKVAAVKASLKKLGVNVTIK